MPKSVATGGMKPLFGLWEHSGVLHAGRELVCCGSDETAICEHSGRQLQHVPVVKQCQWIQVRWAAQLIP